MKKNSFILLFILIVSLSFAKTYDIDFGTKENTVRLQENDYQKLSMNLTFEGMSSFEVESKKGIFNEIIIPKTYNIGEVGTPKLPAVKKLIEIPFGAEVSVNVLNYSTTEYNLSDFGINNPIIPVQPSLPKSIDDLTSVEFEYNENYYSMNRFSDFEIATVEILGVMRGIRLARLVVAPVNYNPVTGIIQVYNEIELEVNFTGSNIELSKNIKASTFSPYFESVYQKICNYRVDHDYPSHPDLTTYPVKYLIVSDRMFESTLTDFIEWKTKKGFNVVIAYTDVIGTTTSAIQTYVHDQYNAGTPEDPTPSFVLFVGDTGQVPASATGSSSGKATDLYYGSVDGDYFPEMYYGRMSATNTTQLQAQIDKILYYEKYEFSDPTYLDNVTLIAGADGTWNPRVGQPTIIYGTNNYFNTAHGYADVHSYLTTYTGCYDTVDDGIGFINYTAHCSQTSWGNPSLSQSKVNAFTNNGKYPLAIGNCCLAADFGYSECIGETWMRKANGGAVGYIGSSPSSYWFEDFYWSVGAFPIVGNNNGYVPTYEETTWGAYDAGFMSDYVSQDALVFVGNLAVTEVDIQGYPSHSSPLYYWQAYNTLGDPSLMIYHTQGSINTVNFNDILPIGATTFNVEAEAGSYVGISMDGILHGAALVDETGSVDVPITPFTTARTADIVVTKPQYQPVITTVNVDTLAGPYVTIESYIISAGGDEVIEPGETVYLTVTLKNVGNDPATNVNMILSEGDTYITLTDSYEAFGTIASDVSVTRTNAYAFTVFNSVPDNHPIQLDTEIISSEDTWYSNINLTASNPPDITVNPIQFDETLQPDETSSDNLNIGNTGGAALNYTATIENVGPNLYLGIEPVKDQTQQPVLEKPIMESFVDMSHLYTSRNYCASTYSDTTDDWITNVTFYTINNNTGQEGAGSYGDYTSISTDITQGESYNLSVTFYSQGTWTEYVKVWIDWDQDEDFDEAGEYYELGSGIDATLSMNITVPVSAALGSTRMRVVERYYEYPGHCDHATYGEVEDYTINIVSSGPEWVTLDGGSEVSGSISAGAGNDVIIVGFNSTDLTDGVYTADIVITSNDPDESTITVPVSLTVSSSAPPDAPTNVTISISGSDLTISWDAVTGATSYSIYSSIDPYSPTETWTQEETGIIETSWNEQATVEKKYYYVTSNY